MQNNLPDNNSTPFDEGIDALINCRYNLAYESFRKAVDEYEESGGPRETPVYYGLRFFKDFAKGLELLGIKGGFTRSRDFFTSALIWSKKLPPETAQELTPTVDFFTRMLPLDERLRGLFAHPQSLEHLSEGLNLILEPLSNILSDSYLTETLPLVRVLVTARANICMVILYLLGKLPPETLMAMVRDDTPLNPLFVEGTSDGKSPLERGRGVSDDPAELVQWILNQEERALVNGNRLR